jgi:hypothetical protein
VVDTREIKSFDQPIIEELNESVFDQLELIINAEISGGRDYESSSSQILLITEEILTKHHRMKPKKPVIYQARQQTEFES